MQPCACFFSLCCVHMSSAYVDVEGRVFLCPPSPLTLTFFPPPLLHGSLRGGFDETSRLGLSVARSHSLHNVWLWVSIFVPICCRGKLRWRWLSKALIYEYSFLKVLQTLKDTATKKWSSKATIVHMHLKYIYLQQISALPCEWYYQLKRLPKL